MAYPPITLLPVAPSRQRPETFADESDAFLSAMVPFGTDVNGAGTYFDATVGTATAAAATAVSSAATAVSNSTASAASAIDANTSKTVAAGSVTAAAASANSASASKDLAYTYSQNAASAVAYQDLTAIAASKAVTAVDVFVYDTSKDSDGGAWRKRTQATSWYNETLNTATRGSRKEFPAVAVIVAETNKVTIYDGDDPSLPMWMVVQNVGLAAPHFWFLNSAYVCTSVSMLNGCIYWGLSGTNPAVGGLLFMDFLSDNYGRYDTAGKNISSGGILDRNSGNALRSDVTSASIVNVVVNDVAMTVLPDAPIDPATGLQIPTIAVATEGGVSVIKDDGTVADINVVGLAIGSVFLDPVQERIFYSFVTAPSVYVGPIPTADVSGNPPSGHTTYKPNGFPAAPLGNSKKIREGSFSGPLGLTLLSENLATPAHSMVAYTASSYTSGWMPGDIKGAFLADTDATSLVGATPIADTFDYADAAAMVAGGWLVNTGVIGDANNWTVDGAGNATITAASTNFWLYKDSLTVGQRYTVSIVLSSVSAGYFNLYSSAQINPAGIVSAGTYTYTFIAGSTQLRIFAGTGSTGAVSSIEVKLADADRSVNNKGLVVNGTITRTPVATGAELVGYSGFSASNYLEQPYNAGLDFGTGDFSILVWARTNINGTFFSRGDGVSAGSWFWRHLGNSTAPFYIHNGTSLQLVLNVALPQADFVFLTLVRRSGVIFLYANGEFISSASGTNPALSMTNLTAKLKVGEQQGASYSSPQEKQALLRISATAPSPAQIAKIYRDELPLFQAGAACTLYGTSDAVRALAHDDTTDLLHVGTSAGRSVFDGLRRVSNTTVAVGTAISASNNLIVEE